MKIGIEAREFFSGKMTGIGRYLGHFLQCATASDRPHEYVLFCNQNTQVPLNHPKLKKVIIQERVTWIWDQIKLPLHVARERIDVFLTPYFKAPIFSSSYTVLIINDIMPLLFPEESGLFRRLYFRLMLGIAARRATKIMTISENSRDDIVRIFKVPVDKIKVVHLGIEESFRSSETRIEEIRRKYALPRKFILYVGNLKPHKNVKGLIEAYEKLPAKMKEEYKLILGAPKSDKYCPGIEKTIRERRLIHDILFTGFIEERDLPAVYQMSSLFAFPSLYEGFGFPPLEAMACGCPVVSSNTSSMPEILGEAALFFNPNDIEEMSLVIRQMLEDEKLRNNFRQKGLERAKLFTPEKMTRIIISLLESISVSS
jgi:glycosyltransferase involved in cell wall biosynthesis